MPEELPHGIRHELLRSIATGRLPMIIAVLGVLAGLTSGVLVNRQAVQNSQRATEVAEMRAEQVSVLVRDELARVEREGQAELDRRTADRIRDTCLFIDALLSAGASGPVVPLLLERRLLLQCSGEPPVTR